MAVTHRAQGRQRGDWDLLETTMKGIIGKKLGMTQQFSEDGRQVPVTVPVVTKMISASRHWMASTAP